jgi:hypothetical protein
MTAVRRVYMYLVTLVALGALCLGVANLVRALLEAWVGTPSASPGYLQDQLALWAAAALVALPIWAAHWQWAQGGLTTRSARNRVLTSGNLALHAAARCWYAVDQPMPQRRSARYGGAARGAAVARLGAVHAGGP